MAITVPGKSALLREQSSLTSRKAANLSQIAAIEAENEQIDMQQGFITDTLAYMDALTFLEAPAGFTATVVTANSVDLDWTDDPDADTFEIEQAEQSDFSDAAPIYDGAYSTTLNISSLTSGNTYYWRIKAKAATRDDSEWSDDSAIPM